MHLVEVSFVIPLNYKTCCVSGFPFDHTPQSTPLHMLTHAYGFDTNHTLAQKAIQTFQFYLTYYYLYQYCPIKHFLYFIFSLQSSLIFIFLLPLCVCDTFLPHGTIYALVIEYNGTESLCLCNKKHFLLFIYLCISFIWNPF